MYCSSCGKKISSKGNFCKYCGKSHKDILDRKTEVVWTCDYCGNDFKSKELSDRHELGCALNPKNNKFPYVTSPKKTSIFVWISTMLVFGMTLYICSRFTDSKVILLNGKVLLGLFFVNIIIGVIAFFSIAISGSKSKNNKTSLFVKNVIVICIVYLLISPLVFATEGYRAKNNEEYNKRFYSSRYIPTTPTVTPVPQSYKDDLFNALNEYRKGLKLSAFLKDDQICNIAERFLTKESINNEIKKEDFSDLCSSCSQIGAAWGGISSPDKLISEWEKTDAIKKNFIGKYKYSCVALNNEKVMIVFGNKSSSTTKTNTSSGVNTGNLECIGPDGKHFTTTMDECKKLNDKWGKPLDYMVNCTIPAECGGGSKRVSKSECDKPCTRINNGSNNPPQYNTQQSPGNNFYCWDNAYKYAYYTSSGDQCNLNNAKSLSYKLCMDLQNTKNNTCGSACKNQLESDKVTCSQYYGSSEDVMNGNYNECLNGPGGAGEVYGVCLGKCSDQYAIDIKQCSK